ENTPYVQGALLRKALPARLSLSQCPRSSRNPLIQLLYRQNNSLPPPRQAFNKAKKSQLLQTIIHLINCKSTHSSNLPRHKRRFHLTQEAIKPPARPPQSLTLYKIQRIEK